MSTTLALAAVGSVVTLNIGGAAQEFIVVQQGRPSALYGAGCDGTWLLMKEVYTTRQWHTSNSSSYKDSDIFTWLNGSFLALLDEDIRGQVVSARIPYAAGAGSAEVYGGANGLASKIFLLSGYELGWTVGDRDSFPIDGACLGYFEGTALNDEKRIAYKDGSAVTWWTRSPDNQYISQAWLVASTDGGCAPRVCSKSYGIRPALILPPDLAVGDDGAVKLNGAPVILSAGGASGTNLGVRNAPFTLRYTPSDPDGDSLTLTEALDGIVTRTLTSASGAAQHFASVADSESFLKIRNGAHTLLVTASDGLESAGFTASFTKAVASASLTLTQPLPADGPITVAVLHVAGSIPADAVYKVEVTNNALDDAPRWQDVTGQVRQEANIVFAGTEAANGPAFNLRISVSRGSSGDGGYISAVYGAFQ